MGFYLLDHPPARSQFRRQRRARPSGVIVVHTAENLADVNPPDTGAEQVAEFIRRRADAGSYHRLCDADSVVRLMPFSYEAFQDGTGSNAHAIAISGALRAAQWDTVPPQWRLGCVVQLAAAAAEAREWLLVTEGIRVPLRRISRAQSEARVPGFISHAERDPGRRSDPGRTFPWDLFFWLIQPPAAPPIPPKTEEDPMPQAFIKRKGGHAIYLTDGLQRRWVRTVEDIDGLREAGWHNVPLQDWDAADVDQIPLIGVGAPEDG